MRNVVFIGWVLLLAASTHINAQRSQITTSLDQPADDNDAPAEFGSDDISGGDSAPREKRAAARWRRMSRKVATHEITTRIFQRFPGLNAVKRKTIQNSLLKASSNELVKAARILQQLCPSPKKCTLLPPLRSLDYKLQYVPDKKLVTCVIPKNLSSLLTTIMCYLFAKERFSEPGTEFYEQRGPRRSCRDNFAFSWSELEKQSGLKKQDYHKLIFVRDPTERFMSAFEHVCEKPERCFGCQSHECVLDRIYRGMENYLRSNVSVNNYKLVPMHFALHFYPQTWRCDFPEVQSTYTVMHVSSKKSKDLAKMMDNFLADKNVTAQDIAYLHNKIVSGRTPHATVNKHRQKNRNDRHILLRTPRYMRKYLSIFFFDYLLLGYPLPNPDLL